MPATAINTQAPTSAGGAASATNASTSARKGNELGKDDFLNLLITQLKNQDPLKPMDDREFMAQLAQFRSLEAMQNLDKSMQTLVTMNQLTQASSMIGRDISARVGPQGTDVSGRVSGAEIKNGIARLIVGENKIELSDVVSIDAIEEADAATAIADDNTFVDADGATYVIAADEEYYGNDAYGDDAEIRETYEDGFETE